jgi:hypothetical protein
MSLVLLLLAVRGAEGWSRGFAVLWYGLWGTAVVLSIIGTGAAALGSGLDARTRLVAVGISSVTLVLTLLLVSTIADTLSHVS